MILTPTFIETSKNGGKVGIDPYSKLLDERIVFLFGEINDEMSASIISQLLLLEAADKEKPIHIYINSPGGSVTAGLAIFDVMHRLSCPIATVAVGQCASMGAFLLAAGTKGKRYALQHSSIMIHQPLGGAQGQASDILIAADRIKNIKGELNYLLSQFTGQPIEKINTDTDRDNYMSATSALYYGLIDEILN